MDGLKNILIGFMTIIIGVILLQTVADSSYAATNYFVYRDTITWANNTGTTLTNTPVTFYNVTNSSGALVPTTNYTVTTGNKSLFMIAGAVDTTNACRNGYTCYAWYNYQQAQYVAEGTSRTLMQLNTLFFSLAVLAVGVGMSWYGLKQAGMF